ncbi:hypothetical protein [Gilvibacter sp.]|uniref:hypothetical protein n=1 Tax=Gilvibacter sp. TaxID=2729997 RepID=UPI0025BA40A7|nr:hypothetical protein [Gilvibacter sp.]NQX78733.1 hypothetical protein [Gilvibacter sp.]
MEKRKLGYVALEKPIRHGWFREVVITRRVERYRYKAAIMEVFAKMQTYHWGKTKADAQEQWDEATRGFYIHRNLPTLSKRQFNKLSQKAQGLCTPFQFRHEKSHKLITRFYVRIPKGVYKIKFSRAYVTHSRIVDPEIESELDWIDSQLLKPGFYEAEQVLNRYHWDHKFDNYLRFKKENKQVKQTLRNLKHYPADQLIKEDVSWEIN